MNFFLLDTNIVSILFNENHTLRKKCIKVIGDQQCYISFMTRGELLLWPKSNRWGAERRARLDQHAAQFATLFPDEETCSLWSDIMDASRRAGRPMATSDAWIAATAKRWDLALITANFRDFNHLTGLTLIPI